jgi:hypothetical protein
MAATSSSTSVSNRHLTGLLAAERSACRAAAATSRAGVPWLFVLVLLGLGLRCFHYGSNPPVWHDEAAQIANVLHKDCNEMLGPLYYAEACPPLFMVLEKAVVGVLGDNTYALRLMPFLAGSIAAMALVMLARSILPRQGLLWFTLLLAISSALLWHCSEAKPYSVDLLVATALLGLLAPSKSGDRATNRLLLTLAILTPLLIFLSFPALFLLGGVALTLLPSAWQGRSNRWLYGAFVAVLGGSFLALYFTAVRAQKVGMIEDCWASNFPNWNEPWLVPLLGVRNFTNMFRYAVEPIGNVLCPLALVGGIWLWRGGYRWLVGFLVWPLALNAVAWLTGSYPMDASRVDVYATPALLLLLCAGIAPAWSWLRTRANWALVGLALLLLAPVGQTAFTFIKPWKRRDSATPVAFVMERRRADEPVVGTLWEQEYYCRHLGPHFRFLVQLPAFPPTPIAAVALDADNRPTGQSVKSLWLLSTTDPAEQAAQVAALQPGGSWRVVETHDFPDVTVLHVVQESPAGAR